MTKYFFTSESVTSGHPDKVCDYISDSILDAALKEDKNSRVACETSIASDILFIFGEISVLNYLDCIFDNIFIVAFCFYFGYEESKRKAFMLLFCCKEEESIIEEEIIPDASLSIQD